MRNLNKHRLLTSVLCGLVGISAVAVADPTRPKLVVGIMVDQLRTDYLDFLSARFGKEGFNLLKNRGLYLKNVDYNVKDLDVVSSTSIVYTGNYAPSSGIPLEKVYDSASKYPLPVLHEPGTLGNFTNETYSPAALRLSTLSDELAVDGVGLGAIYSISPDPMQSIIMAGHGGSSAFWISDENGKWATTTYYKEVPNVISQRNYLKPLSERLDTMVWTPSRPLDSYDGVPAQKKYFPFRHTFPKKEATRYADYKASGLVNTEVTDVAIDYLTHLQLGQRGDVIDMLNIGYTVAPYKHTVDGDLRLEMQDSYLRLDAQLGRLLKAINENVGLDNTLIFLVSTGYFDDAAEDEARYRIPTGNFSMKRAVSLLNSFLSAKHGNDQYIDGSYRNMIYLDHNTLERHGLNLADVRRDARDFLVQMSGVADVKSLTDIVGETTPELRRISRGIDPKSAGDIRLEFAPGWTINDDVRLPVLTWQVREGNPATPAFIMGPGVPVRIENGEVNATALAPTLSSVMRIRSPNGASDKPLIF
ncbi:MAG: alkaline phosphatase family protein [Muribaculaceae bacterium]|nr:alkaline phosphatase family protein [Muribaculaceae bacterium]